MGKKGKHPKKNLSITFRSRPGKSKKGTVIRKGRCVTGGVRLRNFCWTLWDPTEVEKQQFKDWESEGNLPKEIKYCVAQLEKVERGYHLQGYCELNCQRVLASIKKLFFSIKRLHVERRYGTQQQAIDYCKKKDTACSGDEAWSLEAGARNQQGVREDNIREAVSAIDEEGMTIDQMHEDFPVQMTLKKNQLTDRFLERKGKRHLTPNKKNVVIFYGPTGSGKTTSAWRKWPNAYKGVWPTGGRWWWPDYRGEKVVIFDEFRHNLSYQQMLALFDIHPMSIEYKGGNCQNVSKKIVVTSIIDPCEWYPGVEDKTELERRINDNASIYEFEAGRKYPDFKCRKLESKFEFDEYVPEQTFV